MMPQSPPARPAWQTLAMCAVLVLGTFALFARALPYDFTNYDDPAYLLNNRHVQAGLAWESIAWAFVGAADYWHPLTWLSHMLDWELYGANATGHRATSIGWHAANAVLVFLFLRRLTGAWWLSALAAALFAWHPLRVESVVWMPERKDVMSGFFFVLTLWQYVRYADSRRLRAPGTTCAYIATLALFLAALMCKPVMVTVPAVLVLLDVWPLRRLPWPNAPAVDDARVKETWGFVVREKLPFLALSVIIAVVTVLMQHEAGALSSMPVSWWGRLGNAIISLPRYLYGFFWPFDLAVIYPHPGTWPAGWVAAAAAAFVAAVSAFAIAQARTRPWIGVGWGWFGFMLLPSIGLVQAGVQSLADRYTYVAIIGWELALLWTIAELLARRSRVVQRTAFGLAALALAGCAMRTWEQQAVWREPLTLHAHALAVTRDNYVAHAHYAVTLGSLGRLAEAEEHARAAVALRPDFALGHDALALVFRQTGRIDEAIAAQRQVIALHPRLPLAHVELAALLTRLRRFDEAEAELAIARRLNPELAQGWLVAGQLAMAQFRTDEAIGFLREALIRAPWSMDARHGLAVMLGTQGRVGEAAHEFEIAMRLDPDAAEVRHNFAAVLRDAGFHAPAVEHARAAAGLQPDDPVIQTGLGLSLAKNNQRDEAVAAFARALQREPSFAAAHAGWGDVLAREGRAAEARAKFESALLHDPRCAPAHAGLARLALAAQRAGEAFAHFQQALAAAPYDAKLRRELGDVLARAGRLADAATLFEEATKLRPADAELHALLGYVRMALGRRAEAISAWEEALRLAPESPELRERVAQARSSPPAP